MENTYIVIWVARNRDAAGVGKRQLDQAGAEELATELNEAYPAFVHRAIDCAVEEPTRAISALRTEVKASLTESAVPFPEVAAAHAQTGISEVEELDALPSNIVRLPGKAEETASVVAQ